VACREGTMMPFFLNYGKTSWLIWIGLRWPFILIRKGRRINP